MADRPYHHGALRSVLLAGAERTLRDRGVDALSLRELAREAGVSHAAPAGHFANKRALLDALALAGFQRLAAALEESDRPGAPLERRLTAVARTYVDFASRNAQLLEVMNTRKQDPLTAPELTETVERVLATLTRIISDAQDRGEAVPGDPTHVSLVVVSCIQGMVLLAAHGSLPLDVTSEGLDEVVHHLVHGLAPRPDDRQRTHPPQPGPTTSNT